MKTTSSLFYNVIYYCCLFVFVTMLSAAHPLHAATDTARSTRDVVQAEPPLLEPDMRTTVQIAVINVGRTVRRAGAHRPFPQIAQPQAPAALSKIDALAVRESDRIFSFVDASLHTPISTCLMQAHDGKHPPGGTGLSFSLDQPNIN